MPLHPHVAAILATEAAAERPPVADAPVPVDITSSEPSPAPDSMTAAPEPAASVQSITSASASVWGPTVTGMAQGGDGAGSRTSDRELLLHIVGRLEHLDKQIRQQGAEQHFAIGNLDKKLQVLQRASRTSMSERSSGGDLRQHRGTTMRRGFAVVGRARRTGPTERTYMDEQVERNSSCERISKILASDDEDETTDGPQQAPSFWPSKRAAPRDFARPPPVCSEAILMGSSIGGSSPDGSSASAIPARRGSSPNATLRHSLIAEITQGRRERRRCSLLGSLAGHRADGGDREGSSGSVGSGGKCGSNPLRLSSRMAGRTSAMACRTSMATDNAIMFGEDGGLTREDRLRLTVRTRQPHAFPRTRCSVIARARAQVNTDENIEKLLMQIRKAELITTGDATIEDK